MHVWVMPQGLERERERERERVRRNAVVILMLVRPTVYPSAQVCIPLSVSRLPPEAIGEGRKEGKEGKEKNEGRGDST